ncbi:MAG: hypothetical protein JWO51_1858 [Rhodospirillales bacterium]|nr:hypothetical protein [Rhodospirillales bacterium]
MATGDDLRRMALALEGTIETSHFDRIAYMVARTYVTLAADGLSANFKFTPEDQALKCLTAPDAFTAIANAWGRQGWTNATLDKLGEAELDSALRSAWADAQPKKLPPRPPGTLY